MCVKVKGEDRKDLLIIKIEYFFLKLGTISYSVFLFKLF